MRLERPITRGIVRDWDSMDSLMKYLFYNELRVCPEEHSVMFTEPPLNPTQNREKLTQVLWHTIMRTVTRTQPI